MKKKLLFGALILASAGLVITGIVLKQPAMVMAKAVRICMECIGLG